MENEDRKGYIYLVRANGTMLFKIGFATNPMHRFSSIQTASPIPLKFLAAVPGTMAEEKRTHRVLSRWRFKGEWFLLPPEIVWGILPHFGYNPSTMTNDEWKTHCLKQARRCAAAQIAPTKRIQQQNLFA